MTGLLVLTGLLLVGSGLVKARSGMRAQVGIPVLAPLEMAAGLGLAAWSLVSSPTPEAGFRLVIAGIALVLGSTAMMWRRLAAERARRDELAGARLLTYVKYISEMPDATDGEDSAPHRPDFFGS